MDKRGTICQIKFFFDSNILVYLQDSNDEQKQQISPQIIEHAIDISVKIQCSFWDSLIIAAAIYAQCNILYTEDLNNGQIIYGVKIVNPFKMN